MADGLIVPRRHERVAGFSPSEISNLMSGMEGLSDEHLAQALSIVLGEVYDRHGIEKCAASMKLLLTRFERAN